MACGDLGMAPSEFWRLTYVELRLVLEGCADRRRREANFQKRLAAWTAAITVQPHIKEKITPAMLLGEKEKPRKVVSKEEQLDAALEYSFRHYVRKDG